MKNTQKRITARRIIILQCIFVSTLTFGACVFVLPRLGYPLPFEWLITIMFGHIPAGFLYGVYRLRNKEDGIMLNKWQRRDLQRVQKLKGKNNAAKESIRTGGYQISKVFHISSKPCSFHIQLDRKIVNNLLPEITIGEMRTTVEPVIGSQDEVICHAGPCISIDSDHIVFSCGGYDFKIKNAYAYRPNKESVSWQCEGHAIEKKIFISKECFPNAHENTPYPFDLMINGEKKGTYHGYFSPDDNAVVILLSTIKKSECINKPCGIRNAFGKRHTIPLPAPKVFVINGEPV